MKNIFDIWAKRFPIYNLKYASIFEQLALSGNTAGEEAKDEKGKVFGSNYELYIYAFFIGLYNNSIEEITKGETKKFGHAIENWGKKSRFDARKDFSSIQKYIFTILIVKVDIDFIELEKSKDDKVVAEAVSSLMRIMEEVTNGGLKIIQEKLDNDANIFYRSNLSALNLILESKK